MKAGDEVSYYLTPAEEAIKVYGVLYEDDNVLVIDKESGVNSEAIFFSLAPQGYRPVHRLDRNTEGVMILAKNEAAEEELLSCFQKRRVKKEYLALVFGHGMPKHAVERAYLEKDAHAKRVTVRAQGRGDAIETEFQTLEERGETTLLLVTLHTGKTHQIRAHLAFLGYPVVGDEKYGDHAANRKFHAARQRLLSKRLVLWSEGSLTYLSGREFVSPKNL